MGEALVINHPALQAHFFRVKKQRGGVLAKGFLIGKQFQVLFEDGLYWQCATQANAMAKRLQDGLEALGVPFLNRSATNQVFPIVADELLPALTEICWFEVWSKVDESHTAIRFVSSFATSEDAVDGLLEQLRTLL